MLDISHNQLKSLPFEMWTSDRLRSIRANHNCLESLPAHHLRGMTTISEHSGSHGILMASRQMSKQGECHVVFQYYIIIKSVSQCIILLIRLLFLNCSYKAFFFFSNPLLICATLTMEHIVHSVFTRRIEIG